MLLNSIPFVDLYAQYLSIKSEIDAAIEDVISQSAFIRGPYVQGFEEMFSKVLGVNYCVSCANGTDSLYIAMRALGVQAGDEVIAPAHSWISTTETITQAGGKVIFVDTDVDTFTIDVNKIEDKITSRTVGIIPVHLYGQPADMDPILALAKKYNLWVLEDCAQAHLAKYKGRFVGTLGTAASFSFYPGKNLGAMGDAGAIVTNDKILADRMAMYARHGGLVKGDHQIEGVNSRLDGLQAAILSVKLNHLSDWTKRRQEIAKQYSLLLKDVTQIRTPHAVDGREHVWHLYVIKTESRNALANYLHKNGVQTVVNYPIALPFLPAYKRFGHTADQFPCAYENQSRILSLPIYPEMHSEHIEYIVGMISNYFKQ